MNANSRYPGKCIPKLVPQLSSYFYITSEKVVCDKRGNKCVFYVLTDLKSRTLIFVFRGPKGSFQLHQQMVLLKNRREDFLKLGLVNSYIFNAHQSMWNSIKKQLLKSYFISFSVILTGYSLGGAIASLTALRIVAESLRNSNQISLYTFGQPRIGSLVFAKNFDSRVRNNFRVVLAFDYISHIPPCKKMRKRRFWSFLLKKSSPCNPYDTDTYYHQGIEIWYPTSHMTSSSYKVCNGFPKGEDFKCSDQIAFKTNDIEKYKKYHEHYFDDLKNEFPDLIHNNYDENCKINKNSKKSNENKYSMH